MTSAAGRQGKRYTEDGYIDFIDNADPELHCYKRISKT